MADTIQFFYNPMSRARMAHWALEEVGAPYEITLLDFKKGQHKKPDYLTLNPMGKVPAIKHRGQVVTEVAAILTYLGDAFADRGLAPRFDAVERATYLRWMFFIATNWEAAVAERAFPRVNPIPPSSLGWGTYEDVIKSVESAMTPGPFILGDRFSMADVLMASQIGYSMMMKWIEPTPLMSAYVERCYSRPAAKRADAQSMEMIQKLKG